MASTVFLLITLTAITTVYADCPSGWMVFEDSCYLFSHETMDFLDAVTMCGHYKSHLVHINTAAENSFLKGHLLTTKFSGIWIGLNDFVVEGRWEWFDTDTIATFTDWYPWEPQGNISENCVAMWEKEFRWADAGCHQLHPFICEASSQKEKGSSRKCVWFNSGQTLWTRQSDQTTVSYTTSTGNVTGNTTTSTTTTTTLSPDTLGYFRTSDGAAILALLIIIFVLLLSLPVVIYILVRKFCWIKVHNTGTANWQTRPIPETRDRNKKTQTDVTGLELEEFYRRRQPIDMSKYIGKELTEVAELPRWHRLNPKQLNDPWTTKHVGKETNFVKRDF